MHRARDCLLASSQSTSGFVLKGSVCGHVLDEKQTVRSLKDVGSAESADESTEIIWQTFFSATTLLPSSHVPIGYCIL